MPWRLLLRGGFVTPNTSVIRHGCSLDGLPHCQGRDGPHEKRTVVTAHAGMASHDLEEEKTTHLVVPRSWSGRVYLIFAAIRAAFQSDSAHNQLLNPQSPRKCGAVPCGRRWRLRHQRK